MIKKIKGQNLVEFILRLGVFLTFMGHGILAYSVNPNWISLLTAFGFSIKRACFIMPFIGLLDMLIAISVLLFPLRIFLFWAVFWAFLTALSRPISGMPVLEFVERASNWLLPLALLLLQGFPKKANDLFSIRN